MIWLARSYTMIGEKKEANRLLDLLLADDNFPEEYSEELYTTLRNNFV